ncbi:MAG: DUF1491 family protein [Sphingomonas sp.]|uniref:DUF1491 family protein n=1 Tax=Sphingomonas sp. TaxID=28214 RepID=UPI001ACEC10E|nr:DUF1491 family protein [Sphingomonas sp.]MBN8809060.1 DUF1491 family protein [Sphingomonas sp.]
MLVTALVRRVGAAGGFAAVLARGDDSAGAILVVTQDRGLGAQIFERGIGPDGRTDLIAVGPADDPLAVGDYWAKRRRSDPDLWVIELDVADAQRLAAETLLGD